MEMPLANRNLNLERLYHNPEVLYGCREPPSDRLWKNNFCRRGKKQSSINSYKRNNPKSSRRLYSFTGPFISLLQQNNRCRTTVTFLAVMLFCVMIVLMMLMLISIIMMVRCTFITGMMHLMQSATKRAGRRNDCVHDKHNHQ